MGIEHRSAIIPPTRQELQASVARFRDDWGVVDDVLYRLCRDMPDHTSRSGVSAKLALIGRGYAAGLERQVTPPTGQQAITVIADYVLEHGDEVDEIISRLHGIKEPLGAQAMADIVEQHGRFTELMRKVTTDAKAPRSFSSKYLHFHRPVVPIFDDYVRRGITNLVRWDAEHLPFVLPPHGDPQYWDYCVRFLRLYRACHQARVEATVKMLDDHLWAVPGTGDRRATEPPAGAWPPPD